MTAAAQGLYRTFAFKKQSGLGSAASGSGGTYLNRETATFNKMKDTYTSDEINTNQQYSGDTYGVGKTQGQLKALLRPGGFAPFFGSVNRNDFAAIAAMSSLSLTIAGSGPYTITRGTGSFLTDGVKIGHVVRITGGTYTGVARDINVIVTGVVALVLTVIVPNGKTLSAQGPVASSTVTVMGKVSSSVASGQTNDYYTVEDYFADIAKSRAYIDSQVGGADVSIPATGNCTVQFDFLGLSRTKGGSQVLTSPTAASTASILSAANAIILLAGTRTLVGTSLGVKLDGQLEPGEPVIGSNAISDNVKGDIKVSGTFTSLKQDESVADNFDNETAVSIIAALFADQSDTSDFMSFVIPRAKLMDDETDDGKKQLVESHKFTAEYNTAGGAALANATGIITMQDSLA